MLEKFRLNNLYNRYLLAKFRRIINKMKAVDNEINWYVLDVKKEYQKIKNGALSKRLLKEKIPYILNLISKVFYEQLGISIYEEQYICALALYMGYITEMKTGEGKSICAVIASILYALTGSVHIITVNDYLAERDYKKYRAVFESFGLKCGVNTKNCNKKELYQNDIIYSSSSEIVFDYLKDEMVEAGKKIMGSLDTAILDEVDFVLLDNALSSLTVGSEFICKFNDREYNLAKEIADILQGMEIKKPFLEIEEIENLLKESKTHYLYSYHDKNVYLTYKGIRFLEKLLHCSDILNENAKFYSIIINTLKAKIFYLNGRDYIIKDSKIILINRENGRLMPDSYLNEELQTAIEVKENINVREKLLLGNSTSYQVYFMKYKNMVGMSGTVYSARSEFENIFNKTVFAVPVRFEKKRIDHSDLYFENKAQKYLYMLGLIKGKNRIGQPVLIITECEEESYKVFAMIKKCGLKANLLNNQTSAREELIVRQTGNAGAITVSTNIAGRGTDIIVDERAEEAGGLFVLCLNHYTSTRVDEQVKGRAGRQGQPGECQFLVSFEDTIWRYASKKEYKKALDLYQKGENKKLDRLLKNIQRVIQAAHHEQRCFNYRLSKIFDAQKNLILSWKEEIKKSNLLEVTKKYVPAKSSASGIFLFDNVIERIKNQQHKLGQEVGNKLYKVLVDKITLNHWLMFKRSLEEITAGYFCCCSFTNSENVYSYLEMCSKLLQEFKRYVVYDIVVYFLSAKVRTINRTESDQSYEMRA